MSEFIGTITNQEVNCSIEKNERHIIKLNRHNRFLQILEKIAIQIQNLYYEDKINLSKVFQSIALQISEVLEIDRVEIIQISPGWGQKTWAKVINRETEIDSRLQLPINVDCQEWGYILLESSQSGLVWLDNELSFLNQLGLYIAIAIQQERLKQQWQEEIVQRKEIESTLQEFAIENDQLIPSCDLLGRLKLQQQVSNLQDQKSKLEIENTKSKLLADLTQKIRNSLNLEEILVTTVSELRNSLELDRIVIYKILPGGGGKVITESLVPGYSSVLGFEFPEETLPLLCQRQLSFQPYKAITDVKGEYQTDYPCLVEFLERWCVKSKVIVPIIYDTNVWGFLIVHQCSYYRQWTELEIELLCQLSNQLAIAIKQSELYHQLELELQERRETQNELHNSLKEKEILLKEIHHRVKNNLNIISSLLNLQTNYVEDEQIINMFVDSQNRIRSIALIHEQLYNSTNLSRINFAKYIHNLIDNFRNIHNTDANNIHFEMNLMSLELNLETAIPCGLLINEIITNSCKHAFYDRSLGQIKINMSSNGVLHQLDISDNGIGMSKDFDWENSTSLGLRLVNLLSMQLDARLERQQLSKGTGFRLSFTELEYSTRI